MRNDQNAYSKPVTWRSILRFSVPTIAMSVFMSFYTMVDGLFVSNLMGTDALSAINLTAPVIQLVTAISTMLATGGSAVIMKKMGEQKPKEAREDFTFLIIVNVIIGLAMCIFCDGQYLWKYGAFCRSYGVLHWISQPLLIVYNSYPADEQFYPVYDCFGKSNAFFCLFYNRRRVEHGTGLYFYSCFQYGDRRRSYCHWPGLFCYSYGRPVCIQSQEKSALFYQTGLSS